MFGLKRRVYVITPFLRPAFVPFSFSRFAFLPGSSPSFLYLPVPLFFFSAPFFSVRPRQPFTSVRLRLLFPPPLFLLPAAAPSLHPLLPCFPNPFPSPRLATDFLLLLVTEQPAPHPSLFSPLSPLPAFFSCILKFWPIIEYGSGVPRSGVPRSGVPRSGVPRSGVPRRKIYGTCGIHWGGCKRGREVCE